MTVATTGLLAQLAMQLGGVPGESWFFTNGALEKKGFQALG